MPATSVGGGNRSVRVTLSANVSDYIAKMAAAGAQTEKLVASTSKMSSREAWDKASNGLLVFGAAAVGVTAMAIKKFSEFDQSMSQVRATGQDARDNIDGLTESAKEWGAKTKYSATEAAGGIESLMKAGVSATDVIHGGLEGSLNLAATGNLNVADSAEVAATAMTQFKLSGEQIPHIADLIAAGAGKAQGDVSDLSGALKQSGLVASQFGLSIEDTVGTLSAFASAGLIGSDAGTSFKSMLIALANPSTKAKKNMDELGISAYDASGNFVGITNLAGQLKEKLSGLPQAQRDAAMAQIFGNDAIRAANVLYDQGAEGIQNWIDQVNDAGYASESAAIQQDNLAGDLEKLGGAWDTLVTSAGSASAGVLRGMTQGVTSMLDALGQHEGVAEVLVAVAGGLGGVALAAGGLMKGIAVVSDFKAALDALGVIDKVKASWSGLNAMMERHGTSMGRVTSSALVTAAALTALNSAGRAIQSGMDENRISVNRYGIELDRMAAKGIDSAAIQESFGTAMAGTSGKTKDLAGAIDMLSNDFAVSKWLDNTIMGLGGMQGNTEMATQEFQKLDTALSQMNPEKAGQAFSQLTRDVDMQKVSVEDLVGRFPEYQAQLEATAASVGVYGLSQQEILDWMGGTKPASVAAGEALAALGLAHVDAAADADTEADALQQVIDKQNEMAAAALGASNGQTQYASAILDAKDAIEKGGYAIDETTGKLDLSTRAGIAAQTSLDNLATAALNNRDAMSENGESIESQNAFIADARGQWIELAEAMGMTPEKAEEVADSLGLIPVKTTAEVGVEGAEVSQAQVDALHEQIDLLPEDTQTQITSAWNDGAYQAAMANLDSVPPDTQALIRSAWAAGDYNTAVAALDGLPDETRAAIISQWNAGGYNSAIAALDSVHDKTVTIRTIHIDEQQRHSFRAGGGSVWGPGTATSDDIHAMLSNGEFVTRTWAAQRIGYDRLEYMNRTGKIPKFADGGPVQAMPRSYATASTTSGQPQVVQNYSFDPVLIANDQIDHYLQRSFDNIVRNSLREVRI